MNAMADFCVSNPGWLTHDDYCLFPIGGQGNIGYVMTTYEVVMSTIFNPV
jgi:hypothetical protein